MTAAGLGVSPFVISTSNLGWVACIALMLVTGSFLWILPGMLVVPFFCIWLEGALARPRVSYEQDEGERERQTPAP